MTGSTQAFSVGASTASDGARPDRKLGRSLAVFGLAIVALLVGAGSASAATATFGTVTNVSYATATATGTVTANVSEDPYGVYYAFEYSTDKVNWQGWGYFFNPPIAEGDASPHPFEQEITGLKGGTKYYIRIMAFNFITEVFSAEPYAEITTLPVTPPTVPSIADVAEPGYTTAKVSGVVERPSGNSDPAFDAHCVFESVTDAQFAATNFEKAQQTPCNIETVTTTGPTPVTAELTALSPGTGYHLRLTASNAGGSASKEAADTFTTQAVAVPPLTISAATNVGNTTAEVAATVGRMSGTDPALDAECRFEYISAAAYGSRSDKQRLTIQGSNGGYYLGWEGQYGPVVEYNATAAEVQASLETFVGIPPGSVNVSGGPGSPSGSSPYLISFIGPLADKSIGSFYLGGTSGDVNVGITVTTEGHAEGFENAIQTPCNPNPVTTAGTSPVNATLTGLAPNTVYHLRVFASNAGGSNAVETSNFKTTSVPGAQTLLAGSVQESAARLGGRINPANSNVTYQFEWGTSSSYENVLPAAPEPLSASDASSHVVTALLTGLSPETVYHYRIVATNTQTKQVSQGGDETFTTLPAAAPEECPNESFRVGHSAGLPDCRVLEWATPELNGAAVDSIWYASPDGNHLRYGTLDAPDKTESAETLFEQVSSNRSPQGWTTRSLMPPIKVQVSSYANTSGIGAVSEDFSKTVVLSKQPLAGAESPTTGEVQYYYHPAPGTYIPITTHGNHYAASFSCCPTSRDFTHVFYVGESKQLPEDPLESGNTYEWSGGQLRLVGILPASGGHPEEPAPSGAYMPQPQNGKGSLVSDDGSQVLFKVNGEPGLYLRSEAKHSAEISTTQRTVDPDPNPPANVRTVGMSDDGSNAYFESASELTNDANTGQAGGVANDSGSDLYSYDISTGKLKDLTVDGNPADAATGANVQWVLGHTLNFEYIYFIARGDLAPGGVSGAENLYVWHNGEISYVAENPSGYQESGYVFYVTPNGRYAAFLSTTVPTAYDNVNPKTKEPMTMVFKYTYKGALECASCRPSGAPPTSSAGISGRAISADGSELFFGSSDAILPQSVHSLERVYEYENGEVHMVSPPDAVSSATLFDASESGEDVFFLTIGELTPEKQGVISSIYDARVDAVRPPAPEPGCQGENCRGAPTAPQNIPSPGTSSFEANVRVAVSAAKVLRGSKAQLRIIVPEAGNVSVSGKGLKDVKASASKAGSMTITVALTPGANKKRLRKRIFKTQAQVIFASSSGQGSRDEVQLKFEAGARKGGK